MTTHPFLLACRRQATPYTPIWLMRQAGRYMAEYRAVRERFGFLELCHNPEAAAEVTVTAVERLGVDAAIIFADILLVLEPLGVGLAFATGDGPTLSRPVRGPDDVRAPARLRRRRRPRLSSTTPCARRAPGSAGRVPLIGFAGAPFTLASYLIEGGGSRNYVRTKTLHVRAPEAAWHDLLALLARLVNRYLRGQIAAGAEAVQLFDSWVGCLSPDDYRAYVLPHARAALDGLSALAPVIHFGTDTGGLLELHARRRRRRHRRRLAHRPRRRLAAHRPRPRRAGQPRPDRAVRPDRRHPPPGRRPSSRRAAGRPGHIFNLGHGILPQTPVDHVGALVDAVHEMSAEKKIHG